MIAIINRGPFTEDLGGERNYEIKINNDTICFFKHYRRDGLAECLRKAADAVAIKDREEEWNTISTLMEQ